MSKSAEARAIFKHLRHRDVDSKIKESRDDLLLIMQSEHKHLNLKIDNLESKVDAKFDALESKVDARIDALESKVDARIDALESKVDARIDALESRIDLRIDGLEARVDGLDKRMDRMEHRMEEQTFQIVSMKKWAIGLFVAVLLSIMALAAPIYISMFI